MLLGRNMWSGDMCILVGVYTDILTLSLSCKQTVFIYLRGLNRLCLSFECMMQRWQCDMLLWKHSGISLAVVLCAFHHIRYNNKHNNVGGEREGERESILKRIRSALNWCQFDQNDSIYPNLNKRHRWWKNKGLMRGKKRCSNHQEESVCVCRSCYLAVAPISSFSFFPLHSLLALATL